MTEVELDILAGTNPLGFFAALGCLDVVQRRVGERHPALRWSDGLVPQARLAGLGSVDELIDLVMADHDRWQRSPVLYSGPGGAPLDDLKPAPSAHHDWAERIAETASATERADADLFAALLAEGATAGKGDAKPTHFHFTAGRQQFLIMVRELVESLTRAHVDEALRGPWRAESTLPVLGWDASGERIFALRGFDPSTERRTGVPGANWLAFLGLTFFPVATANGRLQTAGCADEWRGTFTWPLWTVPLTAAVVRSLLVDRDLIPLSEEGLKLRGVSRLLRSQVRRSAQGGYGSFGAATSVVPRQPGRKARARG